jgi:hypothetical protein
MRPNQQAIFEDRFRGGQLLADRYTIDQANGTIAGRPDGYAAQVSSLLVAADNAVGDSVQISTLVSSAPLQFALSKESKMRFRFCVVGDDAVEIKVGFYQSATNYVAFRASTDLTQNGTALEANAGGSVNRAGCFLVLGDGWHTAEIRLLGSGNGAEMVMDRNEDSKVSIAAVNMPSGDEYALFAYAETRGSAGVASGEQRGLLLDYWMAWNARG